MSDIKKIKDEYLNKLDKDQNIESINQIKTELFGNLPKIFFRMLISFFFWKG